jgi:mono/diheme cytochrome c family protein
MLSMMNTGVAAILLVIAGTASAADAAAARHGELAPDASAAFIEQYCGKCHNATDWAGGVAFDTLDVGQPGGDAEVWEKAVRKLRGRMMPPPGEPQPSANEVGAIAATLEYSLDRHAAAEPNPGSKGLHRLNRPEYANAIRDILGLSVDVQSLLPRDDQSHGFDNIADVLKVSPAFFEQYLQAARQVSIQAVGNPGARATSRIYPGTLQAQQYLHLEGLPLGTRGGMLVEHDFPVDGEYELTISGLVGGGYLWGVMDQNTLLVTVDDVRVFEATLGGGEDLDAIDLRQAEGIAAIDARFRNIRMNVTAGRHRIGITYRQKTAAESNEILHSWIPVAGMQQMVNGNSGGPRISNVEIRGPVTKGGVSETPSRRLLFTCRPRNAADEQPCAREILGTVARRAFRRHVTDDDLAGALQFYAQGRAEGSFDAGIQKGLMAILASPKFLYRMHTPPADAKPGQTFALNDLDLASRLSFFLWSAPPDEALLDTAAAGRLREPAVLEAQVRRMLADRRSEALVTTFAGQWLNVRGLELVNPDPNLFPEYTDDLVPLFQKELELFVGSIFHADRSVIDLLTARHSFVNERLALHYGLKGVRGGQFRRVEFTEPYRAGLLGKGALLMGTSYANRTTPVLRGAYILEHLLGTPPAAPPPNVEAFPENQEGGAQQTVRSRLEMHRRQKSCNSCHGVIDPLGLALENFNAIGQWRDKDIDAGTKIDSTGRLVDGTPLLGPDDLRKAIVERPELYVTTFTEYLMTYALGRNVQYYDMPTIRAIVRDARARDYRFSGIVLGIVRSPAFLTDRLPTRPAVPVTPSTASRQ